MEEWDYLINFNFNKKYISINLYVFNSFKEREDN
jgi:hypothetical protein